MLSRLMKNFVCMENNENGFTFIAMLFTLLIIVITLPFLVHILNNIRVTSIDEDLSVQQFFVFIRNDALEARHVYSKDDKILFDLKTDETAKIDLYNNVIRRQVDGKGHEVYLRNITSFSVEPVSYGLHIRIKTLEGEEHEKTIAHYNE